jgi:hypothetical protein
VTPHSFWRTACLGAATLPHRWTSLRRYAGVLSPSHTASMPWFSTVGSQQQQKQQQQQLLCMAHVSVPALLRANANAITHTADVIEQGRHKSCKHHPFSWLSEAYLLPSSRCCQATGANIVSMLPGEVSVVWPNPGTAVKHGAPDHLGITPCPWLLSRHVAHGLHPLPTDQRRDYSDCHHPAASCALLCTHAQPCVMVASS